MINPPDFKLSTTKTVLVEELLTLLDKLDDGLCDIYDDIDALNVTSTRVSDGDGEKKIVLDHLDLWIDFLRGIYNQLVDETVGESQ